MEDKSNKCEFEITNEQVAKELFNFLKQRGIEGSIENQDGNWVLIYELSEDFFNNIIDFYKNKALKIEKQNKIHKIENYLSKEFENEAAMFKECLVEYLKQKEQ